MMEPHYHQIKLATFLRNHKYDFGQICPEHNRMINTQDKTLTTVRAQSEKASHDEGCLLMCIYC